VVSIILVESQHRVKALTSISTAFAYTSMWRKTSIAGWKINEDKEQTGRRARRLAENIRAVGVRPRANRYGRNETKIVLSDAIAVQAVCSKIRWGARSDAAAAAGVKVWMNRCGARVKLFISETDDKYNTRWRWNAVGADPCNLIARAYMGDWIAWQISMTGSTTGHRASCSYIVQSHHWVRSTGMTLAKCIELNV